MPLTNRYESCVVVNAGNKATGRFALTVKTRSVPIKEYAQHDHDGSRLDDVEPSRVPVLHQESMENDGERRYRVWSNCISAHGNNV